MSFLNQLKAQAQAQAAQTAQAAQGNTQAENLAKTEAALKTTYLYLADLVKQLNVLAPDGPSFNIEGKSPWPAMKLVEFRLDARKKALRDQEVTDYIAMGWRIVPRAGSPVSASASASFLPDFQRIEAALQAGAVKYERVQVRSPDKPNVTLVRFDYVTEARGSLTIQADHDQGLLNFRLGNVNALNVIHRSYPAAQLHTDVLDELAKLIVGHPSRFI